MRCNANSASTAQIDNNYALLLESKALGRKLATGKSTTAGANILIFIEKIPRQDQIALVPEMPIHTAYTPSQHFNYLKQTQLTFSENFQQIAG